MFRYITARICLYDPGLASDSPVAVIKKIAEEEAKKQRTLELAEVTSIYPHGADSDNDNYDCDVKLKNGGNELRKVPILTPHIGFTWVPDIGDLVLIGYVGGSVNSPVVLGSLYNDDQRPPVNDKDQAICSVDNGGFKQLDFTFGADNRLRIDGTKGAMWDINGSRLLMSIDGMGFVDHKDHSYIVQGLKDSGGTVFVGAASGIVIGISSNVMKLARGTGSEQIVIKADKDIRIECGGTLTLKGKSINLEGGDVSIGGGSIKAKGTQLDLEGNTVDINGSGTTTIKGGIVKIN